MPTGYTHELMDKGQDFRTFVLLCARAMGACIMQRDDPMKDEPKRQEPHDYNAKRLAEARAELRRLESMTHDGKYAFGTERKHDAITSAASHIQEYAAQNARLDAMMTEVVAWKPPTKDHVGLKSFMIEQMTISKISDDYWRETLDAATRRSAMDYYTDAVAKAHEDIAYHVKATSEEEELTKGRNDWIDALYASLPSAPCISASREP